MCACQRCEGRWGDNWKISMEEMTRKNHKLHQLKDGCYNTLELLVSRGNN